MTLSEELQWRGFINQTTFSDITDLDKKKWTFYHGFDASADSQTIGNLAAMMFDKVLLRHGNKAVILAGGATSLIGDPGGKDKERLLQDEATIAHNVECAKQQLNKIFAGHDFTMVNNIDWAKNMNVLDFLRDIGKHFSMTSLVQRDYISSRLGEGGGGISYAEFSYTILQGWDYLYLYDNFGCTLQLGGSDQWGNCLSGVDLIRKSRGAEAHVITLPLVINKATGQKFGKSEAGAIWLDPTKTNIYQFYQFWLNMDDDSVCDYLKIYTELTKDEIDSVMANFGLDHTGRIAQKTLAHEVTKIVHGMESAESVLRISQALFGGSYEDMTHEDMDLLTMELPCVEAIPTSNIVACLVETGLASSNSEARRLVEQGAIYLNGKQILSDLPVNSMGAIAGSFTIVRRGKNQTAILKYKI